MVIRPGAVPVPPATFPLAALPEHTEFERAVEGSLDEWYEPRPKTQISRSEAFDHALQVAMFGVVVHAAFLVCPRTAHQELIDQGFAEDVHRHRDSMKGL